MVTQLRSHFGRQLNQLLTWLKGYEESGNIAVDSVAFLTRDRLKDIGAL